MELQQCAALRGQNTGARAREEVVHDAHDALRGPKTPPPGRRPGSLAEPAPQRSDRSLRRSSRETPLLGVPLLADPSAEASDRRTLRFLLTEALAPKEEEDEERRKVAEQEKLKTMTDEEEDPAGWREAHDSDGDLHYWRLRTRRVTWSLPPSSSSPGKRRKKKRRKRRTPRTSSNSSCGRTVATAAVACLQCWFPGDVTLRAVFPSVVVRPETLGIMSGMDQKYFPRVWCTHRRLWQWHVQGWSFWCCSSGCVPFCCRQARVAGLHARLCFDRFPGPDSADGGAVLGQVSLARRCVTSGARVGPDIVQLSDKIIGMPVVGLMVHKVLKPVEPPQVQFLD